MKIPAPHSRVSFDQAVFTARVFDQDQNLHAILADALGTGRLCKKEINGRTQWGVFFPDARIWCSRYKNKFGFYWISLPATEDHLFILGIVAKNNSIHLFLHSIEIAFDFPCFDLSFAEADILWQRLAMRVEFLPGRSVRNIEKTGNFQVCGDEATNGKSTVYFHALDQKLLIQNGKKKAGRFISAKGKIYTKKIDGSWIIRAEVTFYIRRQPKHKRVIPFLPHDLEMITKLLPNFNFENYWRLIQVDITAFRQKVIQISKRKWGNRIPPCIFSMLNESAALPFHEQRQKMREIAIYLGSRRLKESLKEYFCEITLEEAPSCPLPGEVLSIGISGPTPSPADIRGDKASIDHGSKLHGCEVMPDQKLTGALQASTEAPKEHRPTASRRTRATIPAPGAPILRTHPDQGIERQHQM